jgi:5-methyltetrahydropteroyltriglutamate--homocysteine methyltransferase
MGFASAQPIPPFKRRIEEATKYISLDQLAISRQCGFASDVVGNLLGAAQA